MRSSTERAAHGLAWLSFLCFSLPACAPEAVAPVAPVSPGATTASTDEDARTQWETCYSTFSPTGDASGDLARLVRDCGTTGGMRPVSGIRVGSQAEQDPVDRYTFQVPAAGKCYRVYATSDAAVQDLDLLLRGTTGDALVADVTHDSWPVLPPREPICFSEPGLYMLEVSVFRGAGHYALQVWGR